MHGFPPLSESRASPFTGARPSESPWWDTPRPPICPIGVARGFHLNIGMAPHLRHTAGSDEQSFFPFVLVLNSIRAGLDESRSDLIIRFIEFWCQKNCNGDWRVEETNSTITVFFSLSRDIILFKFSDEYDYFNERPAQVQFTMPLETLPICFQSFAINMQCVGKR